jgi:hypothetical protein
MTHPIIELLVLTLCSIPERIRDNDEVTLHNWKFHIIRPSKRNSKLADKKWIVKLSSKMADNKHRQIQLRLCDSMENAEATKSRVLVLLRRMSADEIKEQFDIEKGYDTTKPIKVKGLQHDWYVGYNITRSKFRVYIRSPRVNGIGNTSHVGQYETKLECEKVMPLVAELLKTVDPPAAISRMAGHDAQQESEHDAQQESVLNLPYIHNLEPLNDKICEDIRNMVLDRIAQFKAYYECYVSNNRPPVFWVPARNQINTMLALLPNGIPTLSTKDRSPHSQIPKKGESALRMLFILEEAEKLLRADTSMRQRYFLFI